jgi:hypothetical protein
MKTGPEKPFRIPKSEQKVRHRPTLWFDSQLSRF